MATEVILAWALGAAVLVAIYFLSGRIRRRRRRYAPVVGTVFHEMANFRRIIDYHTDLFQQCGYRTYRTLAPTCSYLYTVDPANVEYILRSNFANYSKGKFNYDLITDLFGDGIFAVDGDMWRHQRKVASHEFSTKVLREYSSIVFQENAAKLASVVSSAANSGSVMDIQDLLMKSTFNSIFKVGFGVEMDYLSGPNEEGVAFATAFEEASRLILRRYFDVLWKIKRFLNVSSEGTLRRCIRVMDDFVYKIIEKKTELMNKQGAGKKEDILSRFLLEKERDPDRINNKYIRDIILSFVIAGRDTTAGTLSWFIYMMCKHPSIQDKVAQEIHDTIKPNSTNISFSSLAAQIDDRAVNKMHYLHAALSETLRLYPAVAENVKYCGEDDRLPDGFDIKKGDLINYHPYAQGRMKFVWGEDAEDFKPERWLDDRGLFVPQDPFKFPAFQAGPRICLGKEFAYIQMKIFSAMLLFHFKFKLCDEHKPLRYKTTMTLQMDGGLEVVALHR